ncbi:MAG: N-6 DNA methylase, partial [Myxococcota bacterium]|nr:N-6 DNA methylase [Myxococcota bacterium]
MAITPEKQHGRTYTPPEIARFLSDQLCQTLPSDPAASVHILDPSCGDGALLLALTSALLKRGYQNIQLYGIDNEPWAIEQARSQLEKTFGEMVSLNLKVQNYAQWVTPYLQGDETIFFDMIITNPPYVRTQYQGALESVQRRMKELGLKGDLFLLFLQTLPLALKPDGRMGGIVSNKLLQTKECRGVRQYLLSRYQIEGLWDLGDTKLFEAHVLPLLFLLSNKKPSKTTKMTTVYESRGKQATRRVSRLNDLLVSEGCWGFEARCFDVNQGFLRSTNGIWTIENDRIRRWRTRVEERTAFRLQDCGTIRNGLKTTANKVFIRHRDVPVWEQQLFSSLELVFPLVVTKDAKAYRADKPSAWVLYPHDADGSLLSLEGYPLSKRYLEMHYQTLSARSYVEQKKWYKHHVGQSWAVFRQPKLIWKEISRVPE